MNTQPNSGAPQPPDSPAASSSLHPQHEAVGHLITATHKLIASAHEHGRKAVRLRDHLIARVLFAAARRLARLAWRCAAAGKRRVS